MLAILVACMGNRPLTGVNKRLILIEYIYILREKSLAIYFGDSHFRRNFYLIMSKNISFICQMFKSKSKKKVKTGVKLNVLFTLFVHILVENRILSNYN